MTPQQQDPANAQAFEMSVADALAFAVRCHQSGRLDEAEQIYGAVLGAEPDHPDALNFMGILFHQRGNHAASRDHFRRAISHTPGHVSAHNNLGNVLLSDGDFDGAIAAYENAIKLTPENEDAHRNLGVVLKHKGRMNDAVEAFKKALTLNPTNGESYRRLGAILYGLDRRGEARDVYAQWLKADPDSPLARHMVAACSDPADAPLRASDAFVERTFDTFANSFDEVLAKLEYKAPILAADAVRDALGTPKRDLDVLDAGCGTGLCGSDLKPFSRRLVGVDLSKKMLEKAAERQVYDDLSAVEITAFCVAHAAEFDLIVSVDTLVYFGALVTFFAAAARALRTGGHLCFTLERILPSLVDEKTPPCVGYRLNPHGRYSHTEAYVRASLLGAGFAEPKVSAVTLRMERGLPVEGMLVWVKRAEQ